MTLLIPTSVAKRLNNWRQGSIVDMIWQLLVTVFAVAVAYVLAGLGGVFIVFAFIILYFMFQTPIQEALGDIWERRFWSP